MMLMSHLQDSVQVMASYLSSSYGDAGPGHDADELLDNVQHMVSSGVFVSKAVFVKGVFSDTLCFARSTNL